MKGYTLLELAVSLLISIILLGLCGQMLMQVIRSSAQLNKKINDERVFQIVRATFARPIHALDTHVLPFGLTVHPSGSILFADGTKNPVHNSNFPPDSTSNALSFIEPLSPFPLSVVEGNIASVKACTAVAFALEDIRSNAKSFIALGVDGALELLPLELRSYGTTDSYCITARLQETQSMTIKRTTSNFPPQLLYPLKTQATLYLDTQGTLRHLGHKGANNIENQPIIRGIKAIHIRASAFEGSTTLAISVELPSGSSAHWQDRNKLKRESLLDIIFNR